MQAAVEATPTVAQRVRSLQSGSGRVAPSTGQQRGTGSETEGSGTKCGCRWIQVAGKTHRKHRSLKNLDHFREILVSSYRKKIVHLFQVSEMTIREHLLKNFELLENPVNFLTYLFFHV